MAKFGLSRGNKCSNEAVSDEKVRTSMSRQIVFPKSESVNMRHRSECSSAVQMRCNCSTGWCVFDGQDGKLLGIVEDTISSRAKKGAPRSKKCGHPVCLMASTIDGVLAPIERGPVVLLEVHV